MSQDSHCDRHGPDVSAVCGMPAGGTGFSTGLGFDAHRFSPRQDRPLWLACLEWDGEGPGLDGDSDGDVAAHALVDAVLSAADLGDIGSLFGVGRDSRGAGMHGGDMLKEVCGLISASGFRLGKASVVLVASRPHLDSRREEARKAMSLAVGGPVSLTATTTDGMGFTGRGEGVAAIASALLVTA